MVENQLLLLNDVQEHVTNLLTNKLNKNIRFHNLEHTKEVVAACEIMADYYQLDDEDKISLLLAAWFHDTGYISGQAQGHEAVSEQLATEFLKARLVTNEQIDKVIGCIRATQMPQNPSSLIEKIICDADLFHLGTDAFKEKSQLLRDELKDFAGKELSKKEWQRINLRFLDGHSYFTDYCIEKLDPLKEMHLKKLKSKNPEKVKKEKDKFSDAVKEAEELKRKKDKEKESERGIATVFRIMAQSHIGLSQMADSKANILISVNSIILTFIITGLFDKLQTDSYLQVPVGILVLVCVVSIVFGILATRPNVSEGTFTRDDIANKKTNLLFFGNFHNMSLDDYNWGMTEMLGDKNYMNASMIKDNYFLGVVLAKKYKYLRIAYNIFMFGLITAMIAFAIAIMLPSTTQIYSAG